MWCHRQGRESEGIERKEVKDLAVWKKLRNFAHHTVMT